MAILHTFVGPRRYVQGTGALAEAGALIRPLGTRAFVVYDRAARDLWTRHLRPALATACLTVSAGECTAERAEDESDRIATAARVIRADIVVGLGGDGAINTAEAVATDLDAALVFIPTRASPAATTASPDLVLVDTQVIADGSVRPFIAGIGEALATHFAARAAAQSYATTPTGGWQTVAAGALARACWETLRQCGPEAIAAVRAHRVTDAVEKVVEVVTLLGGLGTENGGLAAAHAIHHGLAMLPEMRDMWRGEQIAFGVLVQLELENAGAQERRTVLDFCLAVGLPVCFADLGLPTVTPVHLAAIAERALAAGETIYNEPCALSPKAVIAALQSADARGRAAKAVAAAA